MDSWIGWLLTRSTYLLFIFQRKRDLRDFHWDITITTRAKRRGAQLVSFKTIAVWTIFAENNLFSLQKIMLHFFLILEKMLKITIIEI